MSSKRTSRLTYGQTEPIRTPKSRSAVAVQVLQVVWSMILAALSFVLRMVITLGRAGFAASGRFIASRRISAQPDEVLEPNAFYHEHAVSMPLNRVRTRLERRRSARGPLELLGSLLAFIMSLFRWSYAIIGVVFVAIIGTIVLITTAARANYVEAGSLAVSTAVFVTPSETQIPALNIQPWSGQGRYTLLLLGVDKRPDETLAGANTDVMMILSFDPKTHTGGILSIPRDLFVPIPGQSDLQRINAAFRLGELDRVGDGGKLAMQTIQYNFGIHVNNYVVFTFDAVTSLIDAVGGVDINVPTAIDDEQFPSMNYGYDPLHIPAGLIHMDGTLALKYARTRHEDDDFQRTHRQQQVILAVRDKIVKLNMLPQLIQQAPTLLNQLQGNLVTDLTLDQMFQLAVFVKDIPGGSVTHATIEGDNVRPVVWGTDTVMTPDRTKLVQLMTQVFGPNYAGQ